MKRDFLTLAECADFLGCSYTYMCGLTRLSGFPRKQIGRFGAVRPDDLHKWLYEHPYGIRWMAEWEKRGRLPKLDWDKLRREYDGY